MHPHTFPPRFPPQGLPDGVTFAGGGIAGYEALGIALQKLFGFLPFRDRILQFFEPTQHITPFLIAYPRLPTVFAVGNSRIAAGVIPSFCRSGGLIVHHPNLLRHVKPWGMRFAWKRGVVLVYLLVHLQKFFGILHHRLLGSGARPDRIFRFGVGSKRIMLFFISNICLPLAFFSCYTNEPTGTARACNAVLKRLLQGSSPKIFFGSFDVLLLNTTAA